MKAYWEGKRELFKGLKIENALNQIDSKDYALPFVADSRKLYKIGVSFDSETRKLIDWKVAQGVQRGNHLSTGCK